MTQMAPEAPAPAARAPARKGNVFTRKLGPLPMWAWVAIVSAVLIGYYWWKNKQSGTATAAGTSASQIPQFVNQVYTSVQPPTTPPPDKDKDKDKKPSLIPWDDESKKDKKIKTWEHKHPGQEYPFNDWMGDPTAAQLAAYNANPEYEPAWSQASTAPTQVTGPLVAPPVPNQTGPPISRKTKKR